MFDLASRLLPPDTAPNTYFEATPLIMAYLTCEASATAVEDDVRASVEPSADLSCELQGGRLTNPVKVTLTSNTGASRVAICNRAAVDAQLEAQEGDGSSSSSGATTSYRGRYRVDRDSIEPVEPELLLVLAASAGGANLRSTVLIIKRARSIVPARLLQRSDDTKAQLSW